MVFLWNLSGVFFKSGKQFALASPTSNSGTRSPVTPMIYSHEIVYMHLYIRERMLHSTFWTGGGDQNAAPESDGTNLQGVKMQDMKMHDLKLQDLKTQDVWYASTHIICVGENTGPKIARILKRVLTTPNYCEVCLLQPRSAVIVPRGHAPFCYSCVDKLIFTGCPICRTDIHMIIFYSPTRNVGNISKAFGTLTTRWHPQKILRRSSQENPSGVGVKHKRSSQI